MKIDTHHHFVPDFYAKAVSNAGGDPSGWPTPSWSISESEALLESVGGTTAILSLTAPGASILEGQAARDLARKANEYAASIRNEKHTQFGFFASLPSLLDLEGSLAEIAYALDELKADGVILFTRYGDENYYLGHPSFRPIWAELNRRSAVVFIHPTHPVDTNWLNPDTPQPIIDYPHETTKTAVDLILSNTKRGHPNCKVILSHAGGSLPYLVTRLATLAGSNPGIQKSSEDVIEDAKSFYYDLALSSAPNVLNFLLSFASQDHILYGSDFPYAPQPSIISFKDSLDAFSMDAALRDRIYRKNALDIFPRLSQAVRAEES